MLFQIIPEKFFSILSSKNKNLYWECIFKLFTIMSNQLSFGVKRDDLIEELVFYFDSELAMDIADEGDALDGNLRDSRDKANFIIRKLNECGWISIETNNSHEQKVYFLDYSIEILRTLVSITNQEKIEYQGYIYTIYNLVRGSNENPGIALQQIYENTDKLITGLKNLNSNIKKYIDELTKHATVAEIMDALFDDYMINVVDKAYHRLLTSDNVAKFRPEIIDRLEAKKSNERYIERAAKELADIKEVTLEAGKEKVYDYLHDIMEAFNNMDDILEEIYKKSTQYQKAAVNRARFLLSSSEDIQGQVKEILLYLNEEVQNRELELSSIYEIDYMDQMLKLCTAGFLDESSFYVPSEGKGEFKPGEINVISADDAGRFDRLQQMMDKLKKIMSVDNISNYVMETFGEREVMNASNLPLETEEDFVKLIYIRLYGQRKRLKYQIRVKDEIISNGWRFHDFEIWKVK